jgi:acetyl-CoA C-acetyltransferase
MSLKRKAAAIGLAELKPFRDPAGTNAFGLMADVASMAIQDAGLEKREIDGLLTSVAFSEPGMFYPAAVAEYIGIRPKMFDVVDIGGASGAGMFWRAAAAIEGGLCSAVLCLAADTTMANPNFPDYSPFVSLEHEFEAPYGNTLPNCGYALIARRHMYEYGTTSEQLAKIAVDQRRNANRNPDARFYDRPLTIEEVLQSPVICDPLHLYEIVSPSCGGAAYIVASPEISRRAQHPPVWLLGAGEATDHSSIAFAPSLTESAVKPAAEAAFKMAGVERGEIDLICPYDCYTITVLITIEDAGFCKKGQGGPFVAEHDLTYAGDFPCNTHGGQLSFGQAGFAGGFSHVTEGIRQLMGRGGDRQVKNAAIAYVNGNGGIMAEQCSIILERQS